VDADGVVEQLERMEAADACCQSCAINGQPMEESAHPSCNKYMVRRRGGGQTPTAVRTESAITAVQWIALDSMGDLVALLNLSFEIPANHEAMVLQDLHVCLRTLESSQDQEPITGRDCNTCHSSVLAKRTCRCVMHVA